MVFNVLIRSSFDTVRIDDDIDFVEKLWHVFKQAWENWKALITRDLPRLVDKVE